MATRVKCLLNISMWFFLGIISNRSPLRLCNFPPKICWLPPPSLPITINDAISIVFKPQILESALIFPASLCPKTMCFQVLLTVLLKYFPLPTSLNLHLFIWAIISFTFCMDYSNSLFLSIFSALRYTCTPYHGLHDFTNLSAAYLFYLITYYYLSSLTVLQSHLNLVVCSYQCLKHTKLVLPLRALLIYYFQMGHSFYGSLHS